MDPCQRQRKPSVPEAKMKAGLRQESRACRSRFWVLTFSVRVQVRFRVRGSMFGVQGSVRQMSLRLAVEP
jgi:hypothetical protein